MATGSKISDIKVQKLRSIGARIKNQQTTGSEVEKHWQQDKKSADIKVQKLRSIGDRIKNQRTTGSEVEKLW